MYKEPEKKLIRFKSLRRTILITSSQLPQIIRIVFYNLNQNQDVCLSINGLSSYFKLLLTDIIFRGFFKGIKKKMLAKDVFDVLDPERLGQSYDEIEFQAISGCQAIAISWRCLGQQVGLFDIKSIDLEQVENEIKRIIKQKKEKVEISITQNSINQQKSLTHQQLMKQITCIQVKLKSQIDKMKLEHNKHAKKYLFNRLIIKSALESQILALEKQVFIKSLVAIKELKTNGLFKFIFQQSYPSLIFSKAIAISIIGENLFNHKIWNYQKAKEKIIDSQHIVICHKCLCLLEDRQYFCKDKFADSQIGHTVLTDPYIYWKKVICKIEQKGPKNSFIHPYLIYYNLDNRQQSPICNRFFCQKCFFEEASMHQQGNCPYCEGICACLRCNSMDLLTKMMAVYYDNGGDLQKLTSKFVLKFDTKRLGYKTKKQTIENEKKRKDYQSYCQVLKYTNIFKEDMSNFQHTKFFSETIQKENLLKLEKDKRKRSVPQERNGEKKSRQNQNIIRSALKIRDEKKGQPSQSQFQIDSSSSN